ncbi:MAG: GDSL-type esterase/lipase family protein [Thermodesulfobacteriota bacterium]|jgi:lysophospholipase L1-like esterase|nr:GDSL-type esterase/lipase family protein [Thermodesulfobacteriota bacterium]
MHRIIILQLFLVLLFPLFVGCQPDLKALPEDAVILAFGDDYTYGTGAEKGAGYPAVLERLIDRKVVNAGVPGETTAEGLERLPGVLEEVRPDLVILCHGGEDMRRGIKVKKLIANLKAMIRLIKEADAEVLLIAVPPPAHFLQPATFYSEISREMDVQIEINSLTNILSREELSTEETYPNDEGYVDLAKAISKRLKTTPLR